MTRAGFTIRYPENLSKLCCGMAFSSKGFRKQAAQKAEELNEALLRASDNGRLPISVSYTHLTLPTKLEV